MKLLESLWVTCMIRMAIINIHTIPTQNIKRYDLNEINVLSETRNSESMVSIRSLHYQVHQSQGEN